MIAWLVEALIASSVLLVVVMLLRVPVRRQFGAPVAYALWLLPVLRLALPPLPSVRQPVEEALGAPIGGMGAGIAGFVAPVATEGRIDTLGVTIVGLWTIGVLTLLAWHLVSYAAFRRRVIASGMTLNRVGRVTVLESAEAAGPLAFGVMRPYVAVPPSFAIDHDDDERALALAHEFGHHARGDLAANWIALIVLALHWFNPLAWVAYRAFRSDQEFANDARVVAGRSAAERHAYARAMVRATHGGVVAGACHLHNVEDLKGRLKMLSHRTSRRRAYIGGSLIAATTLAGLALTASGATAAERMRAGVEDVTGVDYAALTPSAMLASSVALAPPAGKGTHRIVVKVDGQVRTYEGAAADVYAATHSLPAPPVPESPPAPPVADVPPVPPMPPTPPVPPAVYSAIADAEAATRQAGFARLAALRQAPRVTRTNCGGSGPVVIESDGGDRPSITVCTDRIDTLRATARRDAMASVDRAKIASAGALDGMRAARSAIVGNPHLTDDQRRHALAGLDRIARAEQDAERID